MIEDVLKDVMQDAGALGGRVYKLAAPKDAKAPFAVYGKAEENELQDMDGSTGIWMGSMELHIFADSYAALKQTEQAVKAACRTAEGHSAQGVLVHELRARVAQTEEVLPNTKLEHSELEVFAQWQVS